MNKIIGLALLILGIVLLYFGWQAHESVASSVSNAVTGSPTNKSLWLLGGGIVAAVIGLFSLLRGPRP